MRSKNEISGKISTLLPVMNEINSLNLTINLLETLNPDTEFEHLIILSPFSTAESAENARRISEQLGAKVRVITQELPGLGGALRAGFASAVGGHVLMMASDLETDPIKVPEILSISRKFPDAIIATTRWSEHSSGFVGYGKLKLVLNWIFQKILGKMFQTSLSDITYGYRLYPRTAIEDCDWRRTDFAFLLESILIPLRNNVKVVEVPVVWKKRTEGRSSNSSSQMLKYILVALRIRIGK